ncbi:MAG: fibronectin type III domain-containing protein [Defluviitaleaceae bacterium]|nr:fibronectin type III domain-containing protein [Defluviitaleaceae bacterium]
MKRYIKKITALLLAILTTVGSFPAIEVFANPQNPTQRPATGGIRNNHLASPPVGQYNFHLDWIWENWMIDNTPPHPNPNIDQHQNNPSRGPLGFDVVWRNTTLSENFIYTGINRRIPGDDPALRTFNFMRDLRANSLYSFQVVPWHTHVSEIPTFPYYTVSTIRPPSGDMYQHLFLTDLEVTLGHGEQGGIQVSWHNPTFDGQQAFARYRIAYRPLPSPGDHWHFGTHVYPDSPGLQIGAGGVWTYEFVHQSLLPGTYYEIMVVPYANQLPIYSATSILIGNTRYDFAFSNRNGIDRGFISEQPFYQRPTLVLRPEGFEYLLLTWTLPAVSAPNRIEMIRIWQWTSPPGPDFVPNVGNANLIHTILGTQAGTATSHLVRRPPPPEVPSWYMVEITVFIGGVTIDPPMRTNYVIYDPRFDTYAPYSPTIRTITANVPDPVTLDIDWRAFTRPVYREADRHMFQMVGANFVSSSPDNQDFVIDHDIVFYVFITDDIQRLDLPTLAYVERLPAPSLSAPQRHRVREGDFEPPLYDYFYLHRFTHYINAQGVRTPITGNKIYYIRIHAVRPEDGRHISNPDSYGSIFVPPTDPIGMIPEIIPVRVKEDEDGIQLIDDTSITIEWNIRWFEIYDPETRTWHDVAARDSQNNLVYGRIAESLDDHVRLWPLDPATVNLSQATARIHSALGLTGAEAAARPLRLMDTRPSRIANYEVHVVEYAIMSEFAGDAEDPYYVYLLDIEPRDEVWESIGLGGVVEDSNGNRRYSRVNFAHNEPSRPMKNNTAYVIFFRPRNTHGPSYWPTYTNGTTTALRPPLDVDPTVPVLRVERYPITDITAGTTDVSITVSWNGSFEMEYELWFSELLVDYPTGGNRVQALAFGQDLEEAGVILRDGRLYYTITGLFPYTLYHVWIRARVGDRHSVWSNPVNERTLDIQPPQPPRGLRTATNASLNAFNTENGTTYRVGEPDNLILEWVRIFADLHNEHPGPARTDYDTIGDYASATWLDSPSLTATYMAKFEELIPNRTYHVRVWTVLTVTRGNSPTGIVRSYSYRMQLSPTEDFFTYIEITIPALDALNPNPSQMRRIESLTYHYRTFRSGEYDDEYDGYQRPEQHPLPERDWELTYDTRTSTLTFRFRTDQLDQTGLRDQNVDQRMISRLLQDRTFVYDIDMSTYRDRPVANAVVEVPYSILQAFDERQVDLEITMGNLRATFPPGSLATPEVNALAGTGPSTMARFFLSSGTPGAPNLAFSEGYASAPRELAVQMITPTRTLNFENFAEPVELAFSLAGQALLMEQNVALYTATPWTRGWERVNAAHSPVTGELTFNAYQTGNFAVIAQAAPAQLVPNHPSRDAFLRINSRVAITDMATFNPNEPVSGNAFNNLVMAVAMGNASVAIYSAVPQADVQSLTRAGLFVPGEIVSREAAMVTLVTLYERRTGRSINSDPSSAPPDMGLANPSSHGALIDAAHLGFFMGSARPTEALTMGDFMTMLDIIILDSR